MKRIINPTIVHSATQPTEKVDLWIKALPNNQNTLMIFDNGYENVDSNLTERLNNEAQAREDADIAEANKRLEEDIKLNNRVDKEITDRTNADSALSNRITTNLNSINTINSKIPSQASSTNQLADKEFVNSSIANNAATFQGTFETVNDLPTTNVKNNDYAFIVSVTSEGNPEYKRYKYNGTQWIEEFTLNNSSFTANQWAAINSGITDTWINDTNEKLENITSTTIIEITWSELKAKKDAGELTLGQLYRINDYQCTTTQSGTKSAGHQFDIIVLALSKNILSEQAYAALHSGDTYFANSNLSAWKLWYCLDNDTNRFAWADSTNGKGVIYRMIDEFNNDVPYDFKNIQFYRQWDSNTSLWSTATLDTSVSCYTFSSEGNSDTTSFTDTSLNKSVTVFDMVYSNVIKSCINPENGKNLYLNNNCFFGTGCSSNTFGNECFFNTFGSQCGGNTFRNNCYSNTFGNNCIHNTFGDTFHDNTFGSLCYSNTFGPGCSGITFGNDCYNNTFGPNCSNIKFASDKEATTKYTYYRNNYFGANCGFIIFTGTGTAGEYAQVQNYNFAQRLQGAPRAYLTIDGVRNRSYETKVAKNSAGELKIYCEADLVQ